MKCEFCGSELPYNVHQCPGCGAPCACILPPAQPIVPSDNTGNQKHDVSNSSKNCIPMGSADISFLNPTAEQPEEPQKRKSAGLLNGKGVIIIFIAVVILIILSRC